MNTHKHYVPYEVDQGFKYRNIFLLAVALIFLIRLLFFPESVMSNFNDLPLTSENLEYLQQRAVYIVLATMLYLYSYYRDWYFDTVAFIVFELAICNMVGDFVHVYAKYDYESIPALLIFFSLLRFAATVCLFLNTFNSHRAPLFSQRFWPEQRCKVYSK